MPDEDLFATGIADPRLLRQLGITRVGDLTGLDTVGLPVWFACRPNARALSVSQGKGATDRQARISAIMEAAEGACAERPEDLVIYQVTPQEARNRGLRPLDFDRLMRIRPDRLHPSQGLAWVQGHSLRAGSKVAAPYELIGLDMRHNAPWDHGAFAMSSIGLGAGANDAAAILHALLEVIEHDATSTLDLLGLSIAKPVRHDAGAHEELDRLIALVHEAGFAPRFFALGGRVPIPVIACFLDRQVATDEGVGTTLTAGFACRLDAYQAAAAALLECVQSRATDIAGARDDIKDQVYRGSRASLRQSADPLASFDLVPGHLPCCDHRDPEANLRDIMHRLARAGIDDVFCFPLAPKGLGFSVFRVLVPDLGASMEAGISQGGMGLLDALMKAAT